MLYLYMKTGGLLVEPCCIHVAIFVDNCVDQIMVAHNMAGMIR